MRHFLPFKSKLLLGAYVEGDRTKGMFGKILVRLSEKYCGSLSLTEGGIHCSCLLKRMSRLTVVGINDLNQAKVMNNLIH